MNNYEKLIEKRAKEIRTRMRQFGLNTGFKRFKQWKEKQKFNNIKTINI